MFVVVSNTKVNFDYSNLTELILILWSFLSTDNFYVFIIYIYIFVYVIELLEEWVFMGPRIPMNASVRSVIIII